MSRRRSTSATIARSGSSFPDENGDVDEPAVAAGQGRLERRPRAGSTTFGRAVGAGSVLPLMAERLAIIGGDAAGMSAASQALRRDPDLDVVAFERGPYTSYSACGIPYFLGRRLRRRRAPHRPQPRAAPRARHRRAHPPGGRRASTSTRASSPSATTPSARRRTEPFDQLVIATGAVAVAPPVPGADAVEPARTVDAAERFDVQLERGGEKRGRHRRAATSASRWPRRSSSAG